MTATPDRATRNDGPTQLERTERYELANSVVTVERGPAGPVARVDRFHAGGYGRAYAGPLNEDTLRALEEVAEDGH